MASISHTFVAAKLSTDFKKNAAYIQQASIAIEMVTANKYQEIQSNPLIFK